MANTIQLLAALGCLCVTWHPALGIPVFSQNQLLRFELGQQPAAHDNGKTGSAAHNDTTVGAASFETEFLKFKADFGKVHY